jgi:hypothetical protein
MLDTFTRVQTLDLTMWVSVVSTDPKKNRDKQNFQEFNNYTMSK